MTDAKRVTFTTISSTVSSTSGTFRFGADFLAQTDKSSTASTSTGTKSSAKTFRLNVELFETDSNQYPEFNYAKLLHLEKKKLKKLKQKSNGFSDPFDDNDDDVARIAKELEKKYGNAYGTGRGKNKRDDIDIGMGYDESDSFIDNTEAYDELIPDEVETIEGGFYINCGALEFKNLRPVSYTTRTDELIKMPNRPKKPETSSSSSSESSSSDDDDEDDDDDSEDNEDESCEGSSVETSKSKSSASVRDKKLKPSSATNTPANPAKRKSAVIENGAKSKKSITGGLSCSTSSSPKVLAEDRASDAERNVKKIEKTTTVKDMLKAQRDNFLKSQTTSSNGDGKDKSSAEDDDDDSSSDDSEDDDEEDDDSDDSTESNQSANQASKDKKHTSGAEDQGNEKLRTTDTNLVELEPDVLSSITEFRDGVKAKNLIGKKFQFDDKLSEIFLKIDDSLLCLDKTQRNMVFAHLEFQLSLPKYYFLRKAKQLRIKEEKLKSKRTFNKLHKAVTETMPAVLASYEAELKKYNELQASRTTDPPPKMPKKKFPWNTNLRNLLYDVYQVRWTSFPVLATRKENLEEFITSFMREKVVDIWPKGWMRYDELQKEIEKRKTAAKKAKEKKKAASASATTSGQSSPNPNVTNNPLTTIQIANASSLLGTTTNAGLPNASATTTTQNVTFIKQFEEFNNRSNANSDTDSVASSSTSSSNKRKNTDAARNKVTKPKAPKLNGDQTKSININSKNKKNTPAAISVDLVAPTKRTDHSVNHIMLPTEGSALPTMNSSISSATIAAVSQPSKHSTSTFVIDLDNYKNVGDIHQISKEIQAAANAAASSLAKTTVSRRESSGDSEIEIVGVFPAKQPNKKLKTNNLSSAPNSKYSTSEKIHHQSYQHNNNNNNNNNSNRKKGVNLGLTNLPGMDVNKMVTLLELGDELQIKPVITSAAKQQTKSSSSTQLTQGPGSLQ